MLSVFEIDMVANYGRIKSNDLDYVTNEIRLITELCHKYHVGLKVIVETEDGFFSIPHSQSIETPKTTAIRVNISIEGSELPFS